MQVRKQFPFSTFEPRWQKYWLENRSFRAANPGQPGSEKPKYYALDMFPYPSGSGLHVGHPEGYTATDIVCRYKRMRGYNVLHPMGWDAFGLPAEQYAITTGTHPRRTTEQNIANFRRQIQSLGFSYDWEREIDTTDPKYYRWTQWIFLQLYREGLAYVSSAPVWYCPALGTVLANEEVLATPEGPRSERGGHPVERRPLRQWMLRITSYAEELLAGLEGLDWPESLKEMQRNWIGRSEGAEVVFAVVNESSTVAGAVAVGENRKPEPDATIPVFTTRPDTLFGATYLVLSPEHPLVDEITSPDQKEAVKAYREAAAQKSDLQRTDLAKSKTGVFTGAYALNPVYTDPTDRQARIPIWIADYVLMGYGTGAIMAVPAHDERDHEFALLFGLPIVAVVQPSTPQEGCFAGEGIAQNSQFLDGLTTARAKAKMIEWLESNQRGSRRVQYKLRDWLFSRQRYWGEPFPITWTKDELGNPVSEPLPEASLPLVLPELDNYQPTLEGKAPLAKATEWTHLPDGRTRETNTMPQWAGSCWYYLRFCDPHNEKALIDPLVEKYWMGGAGPGGVDLYIGGAEHAVLHLLYARFWHKVLFKLKIVSTPEPFQKLVNQGIILGADGTKMSKSVGNIINPDDVVAEYGADSLRLFEMFMGPLEQMKPWSTNGVEGVYRFLGRVWRLVMEEDQEGEWNFASAKITENEPALELQQRLHATIEKVTEDIEKLQFNTAISALMILVNDLTKEPVRPRAAVESLLLLLAPFAPHISEELWLRLGHSSTLTYHTWPRADPVYLKKTEIEIPVQINGKLRGRVSVAPGAKEETVASAARALPAFAEWVGEKKVRKIIFIADKMVNFVIN